MTILIILFAFRPWDIARFLSSQCKMSKVNLPHYFQTWSNLRKHFRNYYKIYNKNLEGMLDALGMTFKGRPHCGIDDTRNIARIAIQLLTDGCELFINETFGWIYVLPKQFHKFFHGIFSLRQWTSEPGDLQILNKVSYKALPCNGVQWTSHQRRIQNVALGRGIWFPLLFFHGRCFLTQLFAIATVTVWEAIAPGTLLDLSLFHTTTVTEICYFCQLSFSFLYNRKTKMQKPQLRVVQFGKQCRRNGQGFGDRTALIR